MQLLQSYRRRVVEYYAGRAQEYDSETSRNWHTGSGFRRRVAEVVCLAMPPSGIILDLGCGTGRATSDLDSGPAGRKVVGIDLSSAMLNRYRLSAEGESCVIADLHRIPLESGSAAGAVCLSVIQYVSLNEFLAESHRVLSHGARFVVGAVCVHPLDATKWRHRAFQQSDPPYLGEFRHPLDVEAAAARAGFVVQYREIITYRRTFEKLSQEKSGQRALAPVEDAVQIFSCAPDLQKRLYEIDSDGFTQFYYVWVLRKA